MQARLLPSWSLALRAAAVISAIAVLELGFYHWDAISASYCAGGWVAPQRRFWHDLDSHAFPACAMSTCFDPSLCTGRPFKIYVYPHPLAGPTAAYLDAVSSSEWATHDPSSACIFLSVQPQEGQPSWRRLLDHLLRRPSPFEVRHLRHWNGGANHVFASLADTWGESSPDPPSLGRAAAAASCLERTSFRRGFDVGIPLPGLHHFRRLQSLAPKQRAFFLTFRGTRYVGQKPGNFRSSTDFRRLHNGGDVVVATTCNHHTNHRIMGRCPSLGAGCEADEALYRHYSYDELMNTTFGLAPAGRSSASYRLIEVMSAGAIPVVVADNYVEPFGEIIEWRRCALVFGTDEVARILPELRAMAEEEMRQRQKYCVEAYERYLRDDAALVGGLVASLLARFNGTVAPAPAR